MTRSPNVPIDWSQCIMAVASHFRGDPNPRRSSYDRGELRWGRRGSLVVWVSPSPKGGTFFDFEANQGGGVLDFLEHEGAMDRGEAFSWLRDRGLISMSNSLSWKSPIGRRSKTLHLDEPTQTTDNRRELSAYPLRLWQRSVTVPETPTHPARLWLDARSLWRPGFPLPGPVRWLPPSPRHQGAGSLICVLASLSQWLNAWPRLPTPTAVHVVAIDAQGRPSLDRAEADGGRGKRLYGHAQSAFLFVGNPLLDESTGPVRVCEGLADALAIASRFEGPVIAAIGIPTKLSVDNTLVEALAASPFGLVIHADKDHSGIGIQAGATLRQAVKAVGGQVQLVQVRDGKDAADQARASPFHCLDEAWISYAQTLREMYPGWPRWEVARQATVALG